MEANANAVRLVKPYVDQAIATALTNALGESGAITTAISNAVGTAVGALFAGSGDTLPTSKTATVGQLFIRTGATSPGLYVCTAATSSTSTWTANATAT